MGAQAVADSGDGAAGSGDGVAAGKATGVAEEVPGRAAVAEAGRDGGLVGIGTSRREVVIPRCAPRGDADAHAGR